MRSGLIRSETTAVLLAACDQQPAARAGDCRIARGGALTEDDHAGRAYAATGPRPMSFVDALEELAESTGLRIRYARASSERNAALLAGHDVRDELVVRLMRVIDKLLDGRATEVQVPGETQERRSPRGRHRPL
jgi:uncharacterized protein YbjT (DUF2867 family)